MRIVQVLSILLLSAGPVVALDVDFTANLSGTCSLSLNTAGTMVLNGDGTILGSDEIGGVPAVVAILSIGSSTVDVQAPQRIQSPGAYNAAGESLEVSYLGAGGLSLVSQPYTAADTDFAIVGSIALSLLTINNRIVNAGGFATGNYTLRTVVTCS